MDITLKVASAIAALAPAVEEGVVSTLVERERNKRVDAIVTAIGQYDVIVREGRAFEKPDITAYNTEGNLTSEGFSKQRIEQRTKHKERLAKLEKAIDKALSGDMGDLNNFINQKGGSGKSGNAEQGE